MKDIAHNIEGSSQLRLGLSLTGACLPVAIAGTVT